MIDIPYSDVIKDILIIIWPGEHRRSELGGILESEFGFLGSNFFCVALCGAFCKAHPAKCPAKGTEPGKGFLR